MKKNYGFTLAEVLIVLAIIGVVAVLAIPPLFTSVQEDRMKANATKALATIANAVSLRHTMTDIAPDMFAGVCGNNCPDAGGPLAGYFTITSTTTNCPAFVCKSAAWSKPVLKTSDSCSIDGANNVCKLVDGLIVSFPTTNIATCIASTNGCLIVLDTNGSSGPTKTANNKTPVCADGSGPCSLNSTAVPTTNKSPDVIQVAISSRKVAPANQRTRNILTTGDAKKDK